MYATRSALWKIMILAGTFLMFLGCDDPGSVGHGKGGNEGQDCDVDLDCDDGMFCYGGHCIPVLENPCLSGDECALDTDCPTGDVCNDDCQCMPYQGGDGDISTDGDLDAPGVPEISAPAVLDFGAVPIGSFKENELNIFNDGDVELEIYSIEFDGGTSDEFTIVNAPEDTLAVSPGASVLYVVRYTPYDTGVDSGLLKIFSNDPNNHVFDVTLNADYKGIQDIDVQPDSLDFPDTRVGLASEPKCVTVRNLPHQPDDNKVLTITQIRLESGSILNYEFVLPLPEMPLVLSPIQEKEICVIFHPVSEDEFIDAVLIVNDDPIEADRNFLVPLTGRGAQPHIGISPSPVNFNKVAVNDLATIDGKIANTGGAPLTITSIEIQGDDASYFSMHYEPPGEDTQWVVEPGPDTGMDIVFMFSPGEARGYLAELHVENDDPLTPEAIVALRGIGDYSSMRIEPNRADFPITMIGRTAAAPIEFINEGDIPIVISGLDFGEISVFSARNDPFPFELGIGATREIVFEFRPEEETAYSVQAPILTEDPNLESILPFGGEGALPHFEAEPDGEVDFGEVQLENDRTIALKLKNTGGYPLELADLGLSPGSHESFSLPDAVSEYTIPAGDEASVDIRFAPTQEHGIGGKTAAITFSTDDADHESVQINIVGVAINPLLMITPGDEYDFGPVQGLTVSDPVLFQLINIGGMGNLSIESVTLVSGEGVFILSDLPDEELFPVVLEPRDFMSFNITFAPPGFSPYSGAVEVVISVGDRAAVRIDLEGVGSGCPDGQHLCDDVCFDDYSTEHCGIRCTPCDEPDNSKATCDGENCGYECYPAYFDDCNGQAVDGCEINTDTDAEHCGWCNNTCIPPGDAESICVNGQCDFICDDDFHRCDEACYGEENEYFCGEDCIDCSENLHGHDQTACDSGFCSYSCIEPYKDCNEDIGQEGGDGCEANLTTHPNHCGDCGINCEDRLNDNDAAGCVNRECTFSCTGFFEDCNDDLGVLGGDGCETNLYQSDTDCGSCGNDCSINLNGHDESSCVGWQCAYNCAGDYKDCNFDLGLESGNGCETYVVDDIYNCGSCGNDCRNFLSGNNDATVCASGFCVFSCTNDHDDCNGNNGQVGGDGCETDLMNDVLRCGDCGNSCLPHPPYGTAICNEGQCDFFCDSMHHKDDGECVLNDTPDCCGPDCQYTCTGGLNSHGVCIETSPGNYGCIVVCDDDYYDIDGDGIDCEYHCIFQDSLDDPDDNFTDSNCDGIDGDVLKSIFVAPLEEGGDDANAGTMDAPLASIQTAITAAFSSPQKKSVLISTGSYSGYISLANGVKVYGGYNKALDWDRNDGFTVTVSVTSSESGTGRRVGVYAHSITVASILDKIRIEIGDNTSTDGTNYGIRFENADALEVKGVTIVMGKGGSGSPGVSGEHSTQTGADGGNGDSGCVDGHTAACAGWHCDEPTYGNGGLKQDCVYGAQPGAGGRGGAPGKDRHGDDELGENGHAGDAYSPGDGVGGTGGGGSTDDADPGASHNPGLGVDLSGDHGTDASKGAPFGTITGDGYYAVAQATTNSNDGHGGKGGGGGGGGGGGAAYVFDCASYGGAGGGGGSGGCGGQKATSGNGGGAVLGMLFINTVPNVHHVSISNAQGGTGGDGGQGGNGADGGGASYGGNHETGMYEDSGYGGGGGLGGPGGRGGHGGGGGGGPSYCFYTNSTSSTPNLSEFTCTGYLGGPGGGGPGNGGNTGSAGIKNW